MTQTPQRDKRRMRASSASSSNGSNGESDRGAYHDRLELLREEAAFEGIQLNEGSVTDFWGFVEAEPRKKRASLILTVEGNLRAVWRTGPENHIGIHFKGDGAVHYVVFKRMPGADTVTRTSGACAISEVAELISRHKMGRLVLG